MSCFFHYYTIIIVKGVPSNKYEPRSVTDLRKEGGLFISIFPAMHLCTSLCTILPGQPLVSLILHPDIQPFPIARYLRLTVIEYAVRLQRDFIFNCCHSFLLSLSEGGNMKAVQVKLENATAIICTLSQTQLYLYDSTCMKYFRATPSLKYYYHRNQKATFDQAPYNSFLPFVTWVVFSAWHGWPIPLRSSTPLRALLGDILSSLALFPYPLFFTSCGNLKV